jgi:hypothetical protein
MSEAARKVEQGGFLGSEEERQQIQFDVGAQPQLSTGIRNSVLGRQIAPFSTGIVGGYIYRS